MTINKTTKITGTKSTNKKVKTLPKGVSFDKRRNKYVARLVFRNKQGKKITLHFGYFGTSKEAAKARKEYILSLV